MKRYYSHALFILSVLCLALWMFTNRSNLHTKEIASGGTPLESKAQGQEHPLKKKPTGVAPGHQLSSGEAAILAVNRLYPTADGVELQHPLHEVAFTASGLTFTPGHGGPDWSWQAEGLVETIPRSHRNIVSYARGPFTEQYLAKVDCIEQRFVLNERSDEDFVISGRIGCEGLFEEHPQGWIWRAQNGDVVSLGGVTVFDADGERLPATMAVTANSTRISVPGAALASASYPVTIDPEIGTNDFRISASGDDFANHFEIFDSDIVYNSKQNEYFIIWRADGTAGEQNNNEYEVIGQRIDANTGELLGVRQIVISTTFEDGAANSSHPNSPTIAYNSEDDEYLVAWNSARGELSGQLLEGVDGSRIGADFLINETDDLGIFDPSIAYASEQNQYLVVWHGYRNTGGLVTSENEIFGRLVSNIGEPAPDGTVRISNMGPTGDGGFDAVNPDVAYNGRDSFLVVWSGDDDTGELVNGENEIFGQLINAVTGMITGPNDFRISDVGTDGATSTDAVLPAVAYDPIGAQFLVVWEADEGTAPLASGEDEIYGQFIEDLTGAELGTNDFRISNFNNDDGDIADSAHQPDVAYQAGSEKFVVTWQASEQFAGADEREDEAFAQAINPLTRDLDGGNSRLSDMGPDGDVSFEVTPPVTLATGSGNSLMICWAGVDDRFDLIPGESEVFGQLAMATSGVSETGDNDFRISEAGHDGDNISDTFVPAVAYNSLDNNYLVVWEGTGRGSPLVLEHVWGNRIDASTGERLHEDDLEIDESTGGGSSSVENTAPATAYNSVTNEFLIVWAGASRSDNDFRGGETEVMVRRMDGSSGAFNDSETRISDMGTRGNIRIDISNPAVAFNPIANQYLVVWESDSDVGLLADNEREIYGQHLNGSDTLEVGEDDFRISTTGSDGDADRDAINPAVAFDGDDFLVVWQADGGVPDDKFEIIARRIDGGESQMIGPRLRISTTGSSNSASSDAENPAVCASLNSGIGDGFLVVWQADPGIDNDTQIYGRYLLSSTVVTPTVFPISNTPDATAINPACSFNPVCSEYVVVWESIPSGASNGTEILAQRLAPITGDQIGPDDFFLSDMGPENNSDFNAHSPAVRVNTSTGSLLAVWSGDDDQNGHIDNEFEIYGQFYAPPRAQITAISLSGSDVIISFRGEENTSYQLQSGPDLQSWTSLPGEVLASGGIDQFSDIGGKVGTHKFWRVIKTTP